MFVTKGALAEHRKAVHIKLPQPRPKKRRGVVVGDEQ